MDSPTLNTVVRRLRHFADPARSLPDSELLRAFVKRRDAGAFAELIRRHGPMVLGVCRRILRSAMDADDAFQATFIVLIRRAASLRSPDRLAGWLHQVAVRTSRKLLALKIARQQREGELFDAAAGEEPAEIVWRELRPIFDDELGRMPDKLRLPAVLCFLEGLSKSEAARVLGWPEGTVSGRLQRARERLRLRFLARGLTLSAGALAIAFFEGAGTAAIPERLFESTLRLAANAPLTSTVQTVANGVIQTMFIAKAKVVAAGVLAIGIIGTGTGMVLVPGSGPGEVVAAETPAEQSGKKAATSPDTGKPQTPPAISPERAVREQDLALLKERLEWEQRMVAKGYMNKSQLSKTETEIARAEELLAKASPPRATKVPDPQQEAYNALIQTLETIVQRTEEGFKKGIVPEVELLNARATLLRYKLEYTKLAESTRDRPDAELRKALIAQKERELVRAEALYKQKAISAEEVCRARVSLNQFRAEAADASGEYAAAVRCREAVSMDLQALRAEVKKLIDLNAAPQADLRALDVEVANAKIDVLRAGMRQELATIVAIREQELSDVKRVYPLMAISTEEIRKREAALAEAKLRLAEGT